MYARFLLSLLLTHYYLYHLHLMTLFWRYPGSLLTLRKFQMQEFPKLQHPPRLPGRLMNLLLAGRLAHGDGAETRALCHK